MAHAKASSRGEIEVRCGDGGKRRGEPVWQRPRPRLDVPDCATAQLGEAKGADSTTERDVWEVGERGDVPEGEGHEGRAVLQQRPGRIVVVDARSRRARCGRRRGGTQATAAPLQLKGPTSYPEQERRERDVVSRMLQMGDRAAALGPREKRAHRRSVGTAAARGGREVKAARESVWLGGWPNEVVVVRGTLTSNDDLDAQRDLQTAASLLLVLLQTVLAAFRSLSASTSGAALRLASRVPCLLVHSAHRPPLVHPGSALKSISVSRPSMFRWPRLTDGDPRSTWTFSAASAQCRSLSP